jgi:PleD family two-component response regulator
MSESVHTPRLRRPAAARLAATSAGLAELADDDSFGSLLARADDALYAAKRDRKTRPRPNL